MIAASGTGLLLTTLLVAACDGGLPTAPTGLPRGGNWPNEPPGLTLRTSWGFDAELSTTSI